MIWVSEMKDGKPTGNSSGFTTEEIAKQQIDILRFARDWDSVYVAYKMGNYDWNILEEITDEGHGFIEFKVIY